MSLLMFYNGTESHCLYWVNYLIVMLMHRMGCGMYHAQMLPLAFVLHLTLTGLAVAVVERNKSRQAA
eukprot:scaffold325661_cov40-Attheya_sp.AAC.1